MHVLGVVMGGKVNLGLLRTFKSPVRVCVCGVSDCQLCSRTEIANHRQLATWAFPFAFTFILNAVMALALAPSSPLDG